MIRLSKLADYAMLLMGHVATHQERTHSALDLAEITQVPVPTVSKILTKLARAHILTSQRGARGGYTLARSARDITAADIIGAVDGPIALTQCIEDGPGACELEMSCPSRIGWHRVNAAILRALREVTLAEMATPWPAAFSQHATGENRKGNG